MKNMHEGICWVCHRPPHALDICGTDVVKYLTQVVRDIWGGMVDDILQAILHLSKGEERKGICHGYVLSKPSFCSVQGLHTMFLHIAV